VNCPSCGRGLAPGPPARCPYCAALLSGPAEGALAPNPQPVTPPSRDKQELLREIPGLRKRERTWKDEVRERVRHRRQQRSGGEELPLFPDADEAEESDAPEPTSAPPEAASSDDSFAAGLRELGEESLPPDDLPLQRLDRERAEPERTASASEPEAEDDEDDEDWRLEVPAAAPESRPVERPAQPGERAQAALVDVMLMVGVWVVVLYFASRAARVGLAGLRPSWPYLVAYLAFLGLIYAACFTGVTGQTLGKMLKGLRVVTAAGRPPGCPRAFLRAALGSLGIVLAFGGVVPMFFDPARRGLHDRLLKTRVVKG
jgi:uncharacterized RDD family membrane protein YckC